MLKCKGQYFMYRYKFKEFYKGQYFMTRYKYDYIKGSILCIDIITM